MSSNFQNNMHLNTIIESMPFLAWYKDTESKFIAVNQPFVDFVGKPREEIIGKTNFDIWPHELALKYSTGDAEILRAGQKNTAWKPIDEKSGEVRFVTYKSPVFDENGKLVGILGMLRDISHQKILEDETYNREIRQAAEFKQVTEAANQMKTQFIDNISHEIRTPMHAIMGYADLLNDSIQEEQCKAYISSIKKAGNMLLNIISDILDLSMIESGNIDPQKGYVDIRELIDEIKEIFKLKANEKGIEFRTDIAADVPSVLYLDEGHIRQVVFNIVGNAVKFTDGGFVRASVYVKNKVSGSNNFDLVFEIQDTGVGIHADQYQSIFDPFMQSDGQINKKFEGTGLGLSISKRLIDIMNGTITVESKVNEGSTFTIVIPAECVINQEEIYLQDIESSAKLDDNKVHSDTEYNIDQDNVQRASADMVIELKDLKQDIWLKSKTKNRISDSRRLAESILDIGERYKHDEVTSYGNILLNYVNDFNLKYIVSTLDEFEDVIDRFAKEIQIGGINSDGYNQQSN